MGKLLAALVVGCVFCCAAGAAEGPAAASAKSCQLKRYVTLPITITGSGLITVPMKVEGQTLNMLVDTGGYATMLTEAAAARLKLEKRPVAPYNWLFGFGGHMSLYGAAASLEIAGIPITGKAFNLISGVEPGVDGILGADLLRVFDVDIDYAASKLTLFSPDHCPGKVVYWTHDPFAVVPITVRESERHIRLDVQLDGHEISTFLDTGASTSVLIYEEAAAHFDVDESLLAKDRRFPFKSLSFEGGVAVDNPDLVLFRRREAIILGSGTAPDMLIGANILRQLHLYIAYNEQKLYATGFPATASGYAHFVRAMSASIKREQEPVISEFSAALEAGGLTADQQRRAHLGRAEAYYLTGDCAKAVADFDSGIAQSPENVAGYLGRAEAKLCQGDRSALADADMVVTYDPGSTSYAARGRVHWTFGEFGAAAEDFTQAYADGNDDSYDLLWFALSAARAGTMDGDAFAAKASHDHSDWPGPILSLFLNRPGAEADIRKAVAKDTNQIHPRQCEADFYMGEWRLAHGDIAVAKTLLQKAAEECPVQFIERMAAKVELARWP